MKHEQYTKIKQAWDDIEHLEHLQNAIADARNHVSFVAEICPVTVSTHQCNGRRPFPLTPEMNRVVMEALMNYKNDLMARMKALEINDTMAMPIEGAND